jgi:hypothetical protein
MSQEGATADVKFSEKWHENMRPVIKQCAPGDIFNVDKIQFYIHSQR